MKPKSHTLFHFTRSSDALKSILKTGFWPRFCVEDTRWLAAPDTESKSVAMPMVCFCDIPLFRIEEHVSFYGNFGVGVTRHWAVTNGLNPVMYMAMHNSVAKALVDLTGLIQNVHDTKRTTKAAIKKDSAMGQMMSHVQHIAMHMKPSIGRMILNGEPVEKDFYQESEWRFIAKHDEVDAFLREDEYTDEPKRTSANDAARKHCALRFSPRDVRYLFVPSDADIPGLVNFIQTELDTYPAADLKILASRITSLETLREDW